MTKCRKVPVEILVFLVPAGQPRFCPFIDVKRGAESDGTGLMNLSATETTEKYLFRKYFQILSKKVLLGGLGTS